MKRYYFEVVSNDHSFEAIMLQNYDLNDIM